MNKEVCPNCFQKVMFWDYQTDRCSRCGYVEKVKCNE